MKVSILNPQRQSGRVLIICLLTAAVLGVTLAAYFIQIQRQNASVRRSQIWNACLPASEAGVEDALAMINLNNGDFELLPTWTNRVTQNNWTDLGGDAYYVRRCLGSNAWGTSYYDVYVTNTAGSPSIYSSGTVMWNYSYASAPLGYFAAVGLDGAANTSTASRRLKVQTKIEPLFAVAMAAILQIDFNGNGVSTDSFDSADPNYSDNGLYPENNPSKQKDNGDVVTDYTIINALNAGNANIKGQVKTGPGGSVAIGPQGTVGDKAWVEGGNRGIQPGHSANDMNVQFPSVVLPNVSWVPAVPFAYYVNGKWYNYAIFSSGNYVIPNLDNSMYIGSNVCARIKITGNVKLTGDHEVIRLARGAQVRLYMAGSSFSIAGNGIVNDNGNAANFYYLGLPSNTSVSFNGNASFTGAIYAPDADFSLGGGGNDEYDFVGASITRTVKMNGKFNFHYDENLRRVGLGRGYIPTNWEEY